MNARRLMGTLLLAALTLPQAHAQTQPQTQAQSTPPAPDLTVYASRARGSVEPLVNDFQARTGLRVQVTYGSDADLLGSLPRGADLYWGNTLQPMQTLAARQGLIPLPATLLGRVSASLRSGGDRWLPTNLRTRVLAYSSERLDPKTLPASILDLPRVTALQGRVGWAVADPAFQQFVATLIALHGDDAARAWLTGMKALHPRDYGTENMGLMQALDRGDLDAALTTHTFVQRVRRAGFKVAAAALRPGDDGNLQDQSALGLLRGSAHRTNALRFLGTITRPDAQAFMLSLNFEYPVSATAQPTTLNTFRDVWNAAPPVTPAQIAERLPDAVQLLEDLDLL
ncbi:extracellular solute-binding protein [Deinococcus aquiradiocola]|uniref:Iron ABC transporter substrate-binding protein n=1 Tax=Deinococcus aquiradiocola TaxID=393059 RepID=A0A917PP76_9DEIO|nr:extracellular solute-binding protein [Deinococcus aquiradiocola]GGJ86716.1 iron ABC transporter substrate-binding protein [Deinococcus aquiradiocola]